LVAVDAQWSDPGLCCRFPDGSQVAGTVVVTDELITFDYWGRTVTGQVVDGPWARPLGEHVGRPVVLVACAPGDVVFGDSITMITTSSLEALSRLVSAPVDPARLRATMVVDDRAEPIEGPATLSAPLELSWVGRQLSVGAATVLITDVVARCAVIDIHPVTGEREGRLLKAIAGHARTDPRFGDPVFGVQGRVVEPGVVRPGDPVRLGWS
jgi:uncharacterized protein YcbX